MTRMRRSLFALAAILAISSAACRTTQAPGPGAEPALPSARSPAEAREAALAAKEPGHGAEIAWLEANDRALARQLLDQGLAAAPHKAPLLLRRALLSRAELDLEAFLQDLLEVVKAAPESAEAEAALIFLQDDLPEYLDAAPQIRAALAASALLERGPAARVALATAILEQLDDHEDDRDRKKEHLARGGWLRTFRVIGPVAPGDDGSLETVTSYEASSEAWERPEPFRGVRPPVLTLESPRRLVRPAGSLGGLYVLETHVKVGAAAAGAPLMLEAHLPSPARVAIDGTVVAERRVTEHLGRARHRALVRLVPGWHRITVALLAGGGTRPSFSLLGAGGEAVVEETSAAPPRGVKIAGGVAVGNMAIDLATDPTAEGLVERLVQAPERTLFGRALGAWLALTRWMEDVERARSLLADTIAAAPRSSLIFASRAQLYLSTRAPGSLAQGALREAARHDPEQPGVNVALARMVMKDAPETALPLLERAEAAAPRSFEPPHYRFRLLRERGWHAEAAEALKLALERGAPARVFLEGAELYRRLDRHREAAELEQRALGRMGAERHGRLANMAVRSGELDAAISALRRAAAKSDDPAAALTRAAELEMARGRWDAAIGLTEQALESDPLGGKGLVLKLIAELGRGDRAAFEAALAQLRELGEASVRTEAMASSLRGGVPGIPAEDSWLGQNLAFDPWPMVRHLPGTQTPRGLDPADRWSRHHSVTLLDRVIDYVRPGGHSLSVRHSVTRLQTKEATDRAGELNLPGGALPLALRTLKPDGRVIDVDRHAGKEDLSFSALAPGDAVERQWVAADGAATPAGGYLRRFYFRSTGPIVRSDFAVVVPRGLSVWSKSYHGAPLPTVYEEGGERIYLWSASEIPALEPEPGAVPHEEYIPFVVVAVGLDAELALRSNLAHLERIAQTSFEVQAQAKALTRDIADPEAQVAALFRWLAREVNHGNGREPTMVLATRRGDRTGLFTAMVRALGYQAEVGLARPGNAPRVEPLYPDPTRLSVRLVRVVLPGDKLLWARFDSKSPWMGQLAPQLRGGEIAFASEGAAPRLRALDDREIASWPFESRVNLAVDEQGTARGTLSLSLPGTFGAELRSFLESAREEEVHRQLEAWVASVLPGARLESLETQNQKDPLSPLVIEAKVSIEHFMVREDRFLVAEQFFDHPLAIQSLGLPTLGAYIRVPQRETPLLLQELEERMTVTIQLPKGASAPVEQPKSFERGGSYGQYGQAFRFDAGTREVRLERVHYTPQLRLMPKDYPAFREGAQEILQATRNRLIVPVAPLSHAAAEPRRGAEERSAP